MAAMNIFQGNKSNRVGRAESVDEAIEVVRTLHPKAKVFAAPDGSVLVAKYPQGCVHFGTSWAGIQC